PVGSMLLRPFSRPGFCFCISDRAINITLTRVIDVVATIETRVRTSSPGSARALACSLRRLAAMFRDGESSRWRGHHRQHARRVRRQETMASLLCLAVVCIILDAETDAARVPPRRK